MRRIVACDLGGTHVRFAFASIAGGSVTEVGEPLTFRTAEWESFQAAWEAFGRRSDEELPREMALAFAGPVGGKLLKLTNSPWVIRPSDIGEELGVERLTIVNDFGAVAHAVAALDDNAYAHLCGPEGPLPEDGTITIVGPGTGFGVSILLRRRNGSYEVVETEGGHIDFAPLDEIEDQILARLRSNFSRVSVERVTAGRGLLNIYEALGALEGRTPTIADDKHLWSAALSGSDSLAVAALDRYCLILGAVAGDMALAHGAFAVVVGGGVGLRIAEHLPSSGFRRRFAAKGRFEERLEKMPVKIITHPDAGLVGAAAAFAREHG